MATCDGAPPDRLAEAGHDFTPYPSNGICAKLGDKWTIQILWQLSRQPGRPIRFSALKARVGGITQRMLTLTLRTLERDGLVVRHYHPEVPPRVEYELTDLGASLLPALQSLNAWVWRNLPRIEAHRRAFDDLSRSAEEE